MKNCFIMLTIVFVILVSLTGCNKPTRDDSNPQEIYYYYNITESVIVGGSSKVANYLVRLNLVTGTRTSVCTDPVCSHINCPTSGIITYRVDGNKIYYIKATDNGAAVNPEITHHIFYYDISTGEAQELFSFPVRGVDGRFVGDYYWSVDKVSIYAGKSEDFRVNLKTGKYEKLTVEAMPEYEYAGRYFFRSDNGATATVWSADENFENKETIISSLSVTSSFLWDSAKDGFIYCLTPLADTDGYGHDNKLSRISLSTGEVTTVHDKILNAVVGNKVFFLGKPPVIKKITHDGDMRQDVFDLCGGQVFSMDCNGEGKSCLCEVPDCVISYTSLTLVGNYIVANLGGFADGGNGEKYFTADCGDKLIINAVTGEYKTFRVDTEVNIR